jgi:protein gp37
MGALTSIEWCDRTFNPWIGCAKVSPGCAHCYAEEATPVRVARSRGLELWGVDAARRPASESTWKQPLAWNRAAAAAGTRARVFCASLADVFEDREDLDVHRARLLTLIDATPHLDWLLLTKRPERVTLALLRLLGGDDRMTPPGLRATTIAGRWLRGDPPANVWLGTTVEDKLRAAQRIGALERIPARVRFLSCEPLLEDVADVVRAARGIHWVIVGGESGSRARTFDVAWARGLVASARAIGAAPFVKQLGAAPVEALPPRNGIAFASPPRLLLADRKGGDLDEWPLDLRVREFPEVAR